MADPRPVQTTTTTNHCLYELLKNHQNKNCPPFPRKIHSNMQNQLPSNRTQVYKSSIHKIIMKKRIILFKSLSFLNKLQNEVRVHFVPIFTECNKHSIHTMYSKNYKQYCFCNRYWQVLGRQDKKFYSQNSKNQSIL